MFNLFKSTTSSLCATSTTASVFGSLSSPLRYYRTSNILLNRFNNHYNTDNKASYQSTHHHTTFGSNGGFRQHNQNNNNNRDGGVKFSFKQQEQQQQHHHQQSSGIVDFIEGGRGGSNPRGNNGAFELGKVDWQLENLPPIQQVNYQPSPNTQSMTVEGRDTYFKENGITVQSARDSQIPNPITEFDDTPFPEQLKRLLKTNFEKPSVIQSIGWPSSLLGRDLIGISQTGSGKTLSFVLPAIMHVLAQPKQSQYFGPQVLIVAPTRELSVQISQEMGPYLRACGMKYATLYGGDAKGGQIRQLGANPQFVVGTPGRILDLVSSGYLSIKRSSYVVLDEADRMLEMGFEDQIRNIFANVRPDHQLLYWTATWPKKVETLAYEFIKSPIKVQVGGGELSANPNINQKFIICDSEAAKTSKLIDILEGIFTERPNAKVLIFTMTKGGADKLADYIRSNGNARIESIHGDKTQVRRTSIIAEFKRNELDILVATDVASRGLDIRTITDVINFSMPTQSESYVHRIGRTARAGASGHSHSLVSKTSSNDIDLIPDILDLLQRAGQPIPEDLKQLAPRQNNFRNNNNFNNRNGQRGFGRGGNGGGNRGNGFGRGGFGRGGNNAPRGPISFGRNSQQ